MLGILFMHKIIICIIFLFLLEACGKGMVEEKYKLNSPCVSNDIEDINNNDSKVKRVPCKRRPVNEWLLG